MGFATLRGVPPVFVNGFVSSTRGSSSHVDCREVVDFRLGLKCLALALRRLPVELPRLLRCLLEESDDEKEREDEDELRWRLRWRLPCFDSEREGVSEVPP
jgi:hypothetical protein